MIVLRKRIDHLVTDLIVVWEGHFPRWTTNPTTNQQPALQQHHRQFLIVNKAQVKLQLFMMNQVGHLTTLTLYDVKEKGFQLFSYTYVFCAHIFFLLSRLAKALAFFG